jgi:hypothetical protein
MRPAGPAGMDGIGMAAQHSTIIAQTARSLGRWSRIGSEYLGIHAYHDRRLQFLDAKVSRLWSLFSIQFHQFVRCIFLSLINSVGWWSWSYSQRMNKHMLKASRDIRTRSAAKMKWCRAGKGEVYSTESRTVSSPRLYLTLLAFTVMPHCHRNWRTLMFELVKPDISI